VWHVASLVKSNASVILFLVPLISSGLIQ
jgi:hypothetical protein